MDISFQCPMLIIIAFVFICILFNSLLFFIYILLTFLFFIIFITRFDPSDCLHVIWTHDRCIDPLTDPFLIPYIDLGILTILETLVLDFRVSTSMCLAQLLGMSDILSFISQTFKVQKKRQSVELPF